MTAPTEHKLSDQPQWQAETLRLTVFTAPDVSIQPAPWWEEIVGQVPENRTSQPRAGIYQDDGPFEGGKLLLLVQPGRIDWLFVTAIDEQSSSPAFEKLPHFSDALNTFMRIVNQWISKCPPVVRIAFGTIFDTLVENRISGYQKLAPYLPAVRMDGIDGASDFLYQINRPRTSSLIDGLQINRLSKWSVQVAKVALVAISPDISATLTTSAVHTLARLETDISTANENRNSINAEQLPSIMVELTDFTREISEKGDIP